jgi:hypothetical protein
LASEYRAKIDQFDRAIAEHQHVRRFEIPMQDALGMGVIQRRATTTDDLHRICLRDVLAHPGARGLAGHQFHRQEPDITLPIQIEHLDDARMQQ